MNSIIFFLLFVLPFIVFPVGLSPFEAPKVYTAEIGIGALILWFLAQNSFQDLWRPKRLELGLLGVLGIVGVTHVFLSPSATLLFGNPFRMSGLFIFELVLIFALFISKIHFRMPQASVLAILLGLQLIAAILIQTKVDNRAIGTLGEANSLAAYVIFMLPWIVFPTKDLKGRVGGQRLWRVMGSIIGIIIILFTGSRSGMIALIIIGVIYLLQRYSLRVAITIGFLLFAASLGLPFLQHGQLFENRATVWQTAVVAGMNKPVFGWGAGNTEIALRETAGRIQNTLRYEYVDHTHNIFLEYWVNGGIIGLGVFLAILVIAFRRYFQERKIHEFVSLLGLLIMLSFNPLSIAIILQFWWLVGSGLKIKKA